MLTHYLFWKFVKLAFARTIFAFFAIAIIIMSVVEFSVFKDTVINCLISFDILS